MISQTINTCVIDCESGNVAKYYYKDCKEAQIEINILSKLTHPNIMSALAINKDEFGFIIIYMNKEKQNLSDNLELNHDIAFENKINYLCQIASGLNYLHQNNVLHLDLKLDNIMITNDNIKIIDFGSSEFILNNFVCVDKIKCTVTHRPPEGYNILNKLSYSFDVWSFGIVMYEILSGIPIYLQNIIPACFSVTGPDYFIYEKKMYSAIMDKSFLSKLNEILPFYFMRCVNYDPNKRPSMLNIIKKLVITHMQKI